MRASKYERTLARNNESYLLNIVLSLTYSTVTNFNLVFKKYEGKKLKVFLIINSLLRVYFPAIQTNIFAKKNKLILKQYHTSYMF